MISAYSILFSLALFSELSGRSVTLAIPASRPDSCRTEQESLGVLGNEAPAESAVGLPLYRQSVDDKGGDEDGNPKVIILSDKGLTRPSLRGLNPAFSIRGLPLLTGHTPAGHSLTKERREDNRGMLQCMIGRVYRPCWRD